MVVSLVDIEEQVNKYYFKLPAFILVLGAILRIAGTGSSAIWFDEANSLYRTTIPFMTTFTEQSENSGDLFLELILRPLMAISHSLWFLRLPSLLAGLAVLCLVWKIMKRLEFNLPQQCLTAALVAFLPGLLWIGQDARAYGLLSILILAALWFALEGGWLGMVAASGLMMYCHSTGAIYGLSIVMIALYFYPRKYKKILWSWLAILLAWVPAIIRILLHWTISQPWQPKLTVTVMINSILAAMWTGSSYAYAWFCIAILITLFLSLILLTIKTKAMIRIALIAAWVYPLTGLILFSLLFNNAILYRTLQPILFPFSLWLGWELGLMQKPIILRTILAGIWIWLLLCGILFWNPSARGASLDRVAAQIRSQWRTGDKLIYATQTVGLPFDYYLDDLPHATLNIVKHPWLDFPTMQKINIPCDGPCLREWVVIPDDILITPMERNELNKIIRGYPSLYTIKYLQAATIQVYLVEDK